MNNTPSVKTELEVIAVSHFQCRGVQVEKSNCQKEPVLQPEQAVTAIVTTFRNGMANVSCPHILERTSACNAGKWLKAPCPYSHTYQKDGLIQPGQSVQELQLLVRARKPLHFEGIETIEQLTACSGKDLMEIRNFGKTCLDDVRGKLLTLGLYLRGETPASSLSKETETN